jgi:lysophospholipase L1-like esterase
VLLLYRLTSCAPPPKKKSRWVDYIAKLHPTQAVDVVVEVSHYGSSRRTCLAFPCLSCSL